MSTTSDLLPIIDQWNRMPPYLRQVAQNLQRIARPLVGDAHSDRIDETELRKALLSGYPDRAARRRSGDRATLATGHGAVIGRESGVHDADWLIALNVTSGRVTATTEAIIRLASRIEPEWLSPTRSERRCELDRDSGFVKAVELDWYDDVVLREHPVAVRPEDRTRVLAEAWADREPDERSRQLLQRLRFAGVDVDRDRLIADAAADASKLDDVVLTETHLSWNDREALATRAPERLTVPSGRDMSIQYADDGSVSVSVKLQELFGLADTPRLGPARTPITFHLLAPNGRPVQTTRDLKSFWERTYPEVRKELRGRYPRHPWPDDPWNATPTHRTKRRAN